MSGLRSSLERRFYKHIESYLTARRIKDRFGISPHPLNPDHILIRKGLYPYIVVSITDTDNFETQSALPAPSSDADYFVLTDCTQLLIHDTTAAELRYSDLFENFFELLDTTPPGAEYLDDKKKRIVTQVSLALEECRPHFQQHPLLFQSVRNLLTGRNLAQWLDYDEDGRFFHFRTERPTGPNDFENLFFQSLLYPVDQPVHYTTTRRISVSLNHNDPNYVNRYLKKSDRTFHSLPHTLSIELIEIQNHSPDSGHNPPYGFSEAPSRPLPIEIRQSNHFIIRRISYALPTGLHPQLELIGCIVDRLKKEENIRFHFLYLDNWRKFFRPYEDGPIAKDEPPVAIPDPPSGNAFPSAICQAWIFMP